MNWLHYLLEANIYLAVFYACYCLFLNKETYYTLNRVYLLMSCVISFTLPVIQIGALKSVEKIPEVTAATYYTITQTGSPVVAEHSMLEDTLWAAYIVGIAVLSLLLVIKLFRLINLTTSGKTLVDNKYKLIDVEDTDTAFSFFNYLFIGTKTTGNHIIIQHELVHIRQKHSFDIIFLELIKIVNWFNPVIYLLQMSLKTIHEYIADEQTAAQDNDALAYSTFLVENAYGLNGSSITHSFFNYNLLKKRIIMLNQKRSGRLARLKYLLAVPILGGMLCASTLAFSKNYALIDLAPKHKIAAKIDVKDVADTSVRTRINAKATTGKGYKYEETGYLIKNKTDYRVIITDKNGEQKEYYKSKANATELAMLKEKYGYSFPKMMIYPKLPPPPPMPPVAQIDTRKIPPPPPPVAPKHGIKNLHRIPPPPPPASPKGSADMDKIPPPPPPAPPKTAANVDKMLPPAPPTGAVGLPLPPLPPVKLKKGQKWIPAIAPNSDVKPAGAQPTVVPSEPATSSPDVKPAVSANASLPVIKTPAALTQQQHNSFIIRNSKGKFTGNSTVIASTNISYTAKNNTDAQPLFIVNNQLVDKHLNSGQHIDITADKILVYVGINPSQISKWGDKAKNGVVEVIGDNKINIQAN